MNNITIGLVAHVDAGKTTLAESLLYTAGAIRNQGRVDHGDAYLDTDAMEKSRGITIFSKQAVFDLEGNRVTLLDTPGHVDFSSEMERTLSVLDLAVLVISGSEGVQGHTRTLWRLLEHYGVPTILFVNKMDQPGTDKQALIRQLKKELSDDCIDMQYDESVIWDELSTVSEELMTEYLDTGKLCSESIWNSIELREFFPVLFGSALKNEGVRELLAFISKYYAEPDYPEEFGARVFKITKDAQGKRLTHLKLTGGELLPKTVLCNEEKVEQLRIYSGTKYEPVNRAAAGEIIAVTGLSETYAGQGLGFEKESISPILEPVLSYKLILPPEYDPLLIFGKIKTLSEEFPELSISWEERAREIHVNVNGEIQCEVLKKLLLDRFGVEAGFGAAQIVYKETIAKPSYGIGHFEPLRHYAEVQLLIEPGEPGSGIEFASMCGMDVLDRNWQRLIRTHVEETRHPGTLTGSEATDLRVILMTGRASQKHTEGGDFRQATYRAVRNALRQAECVLLEPVYSFVMELPSKFIGKAMTDIERCFGKAQPPEISADGEKCIIRGTAPVSTFWEYPKQLMAYTAGLGSLSCFPAGYMPAHDQNEVVLARNYDPEADLRRPTGSVFCAHGAGFQVPWDEVAGYAHMECPIPPKERMGISGLLIKFGSIYSEGGSAWADSDDSQAGYKASPADPKASQAGNKASQAGHKDSQTGSHEEKYISLEEIDAIFASQHRNSKAGAEKTRRIYKRKHDEKIYSGSGKAVYSAANKAACSVANKAAPLPKCLLVDGYNMIHAWNELKVMVDTNMEGARGRLIDICSEYKGIYGGEVILVFDAYLVSGGQGSVTKQNDIYVVYTKEAETADQYIEQATKRKAKDYQVTVATSDQIEQLIVWSDGALRLSAAEFEKEIERARAQLRNDYLDKKGSLGNVLPIDKLGLF